MIDPPLLYDVNKKALLVFWNIDHKLDIRNTFYGSVVIWFLPHPKKTLL